MIPGVLDIVCLLALRRRPANVAVCVTQPVAQPVGGWVVVKVDFKCADVCGCGIVVIDERVCCSGIVAGSVFEPEGDGEG